MHVPFADPAVHRVAALHGHSGVARASWQARVLVPVPPAEEVRAGPVVQPQSLRLDLVVDSIYASFPLLDAALLDRDIAAGRELSSLGSFDTNVEVSAIEAPMGFYRNFRHGVGFKQRTWRGAEIVGGYRIGRGLFKPWFEGRDTDQSGEFATGVLLPLLRGRDIDKKRTAVLKAELARGAVEPAIRMALLQFVRAGSLAYWDWVAAGQSYRVAESLLDLALKRNAAVRGRVEKGDLPEIDLVDNERLIVTRRALLVEADRKLRQAAIKLSLYLRTSEGEPWIPPSEALPASFPVPIAPNRETLREDIEIALSLRPELVELNFQQQSVQVELAQAENELLPGLSAGLYASKDIGPLASPKGDKRPFELEASLIADVPLQRRAARGRVETAQGKLAQLRAKQQFTADKIAVEVRDAVTAIETALQELAQARRSVELATRVEQGEQRKFQLGISDLLAVNLRELATAEAQQTVVDALEIFFTAVADYRAACGLELSPAPIAPDSDVP